MSTSAISLSSSSPVSSTCSPGGSAARNASMAPVSSEPRSGKVTLKSRKSPPLTKGLPWCGMPSPGTRRMLSGFTTSPGADRMQIVLPSRCVITRVKPHSASERVSVTEVMRSAPLRLNLSCSFSCTTKITSPGTSPGASSASPAKRIFWPWRMPFSTGTSSTLRSLITLRPRQSRHLSASFMVTPRPLHAPHCACSCCTMPGPIWRRWMRTPRPLHSPQGRSAPSRPPRPSHVSQSLFLLMARRIVRPL
mmetsp:Transcript_4283/g.14537  ORF Transcript_4283/g.14537 Transcript_4283/m.14537 type:complete len:250 (-) Transcript_4283:516-1265(-)